MRRGRIIAGVGAVASGVLLLFACGDLFHSTDFANLCAADAKTDGCAPAEAAPPVEAAVDAGPTNFCLWDHATAQARAAYACAWLGACETPSGENAFGPCMIHALQAYDCAVNPSLPVRAALHAYWDALWQAKSCGDVDRAIFPSGVPSCSTPAGTFACLGAQRVLCVAMNAPGKGENCAVSGRVCSGGVCAAPANGGCDASSMACTGSVLSDCEGTQALGLDCANFGGGSCNASGGFAGCAPATGAVSCDASTTVSCADGSALGCPSGQVVAYDCNVLTPGPSSCTAGTPVPAWDVSAACQSNVATGDAGDCSTAPDSCSGDTLTSCARGATFTTSCSTQKLGLCTTVLVEGLTRAQCGPPP